MFIQINKGDDLPVAEGSSESEIQKQDVIDAVEEFDEGQWTPIEFPSVWFDEMQGIWRFMVTVTDEKSLF